MTVYIEYVIIDNLIIDYLLLKATFAVTGISARRGRLFLCALLGATVALVYPLISRFKVLSVVIRVLTGFLITAVACAYPNLKSYYINTLIFFCYTFLTGGAIIGIFNLFGWDYSQEFSVAFMAVPVYFLLKGVSCVVRYVYRRKDVFALTFTVVLGLCGKSVKCRGFLDTGNGVYDGDNPVIVCGKKLFLELAGNNLPKIKLKKIVLSTVTGVCENFAVELERVEIYISDEPNIFKNVTLAIAENGVGSGYDVILHPALYKENYDERDNDKVKKVS